MVQEDDNEEEEEEEEEDGHSFMKDNIIQKIGNLWFSLFKAGLSQISKNVKGL